MKQRPSDVPCTQRYGQQPGSTSQNSPSAALRAPCRHARRHDAHAAAACTATACACWPTAPPGLLATISLSLRSRARAQPALPLQSQPRRHKMPLSKRTRACAQPGPWFDARTQAHSLTLPVRAANTQPARAAAARSDRAPGGAQRARAHSYNSEEGASRAAGGGGRLAGRPCSGTKRTGIRSSSARRPSGPLSTRLRTWRGRRVKGCGRRGHRVMPASQRDRAPDRQAATPHPAPLAERTGGSAARVRGVGRWAAPACRRWGRPRGPPSGRWASCCRPAPSPAATGACARVRDSQRQAGGATLPICLSHMPSRAGVPRKPTMFRLECTTAGIQFAAHCYVFRTQHVCGPRKTASSSHAAACRLERCAAESGARAMSADGAAAPT